MVLLLVLALAGCDKRTFKPDDTGSGPDTDTDTDADTDADTDGDGYAVGEGDCDDGDPAVYPGAIERCDGVDEDCDGVEDDNSIDASIFYADADGDGYGDEAASITACEAESGAIETGGDCDDADAEVNPGMTEVCDNGVDDDCDGTPGACAVYGDVDPTSEALALIWGRTAQDYIGLGDAVLDVDEDGEDDLIFTSARPGEVLIFPSDLSGEYDAGDAKAVLEGGNWPQAMVALGDMDGDGHAEIAVGEEIAEDGDGAVLIHNAPIIGSGDLDDPDTEITGEYDATYLGRALAAPGDLDGDGLDELYVLARGEWTWDRGIVDPDAIYLFPGGASGDLDPSNASGAVLGTDPSDELLATNSLAVGDLDGDGANDLLFNSDRYDLYRSIAYVVLGAPAGTLLAADADVIVGDAGGAGLAAGDLDSDGAADLVAVSSSGYYAFFTVPSGETTTSSADWSATTEDHTTGGGDVKADADFDGNGAMDLVASEAYGENPRALLWYGPLAAGAYDSDASDLRFDVDGTSSDGIGRQIHAVPDVTGDGVPELLLGAKGDDREGGDAGVAYLLSPVSW